MKNYALQLNLLLLVLCFWYWFPQFEFALAGPISPVIGIVLVSILEISSPKSIYISRILFSLALVPLTYLSVDYSHFMAVLELNTIQFYAQWLTLFIKLFFIVTCFVQLFRLLEKEYDAKLNRRAYVLCSSFLTVLLVLSMLSTNQTVEAHKQQRIANEMRQGSETLFKKTKQVKENNHSLSAEMKRLRKELKTLLGR